MFRPFILSLAVILIHAPAYTHALPEDADYDRRSIFDEASSLYSESRFDNALELYRRILESGYESPALYYNIANTYLKLAQTGNAILNYERALRLSPYENDIKANLRYANSLIQQPAMDSASLWLNRKIDYALGFFTIDGLTKAMSFLYILFFFCLCVMIFNKRVLRLIRNTAVIIVFVFMVASTLLALKIYYIEHVKHGVILADAADARYEPLEEAPVHFKLYEGAKIVILRSKGRWSQIKRADNKIGWIWSGSYGIINTD
jgi:tetratricopeptide (TPR) repeat protein